MPGLSYGFILTLRVLDGRSRLRSRFWPNFGGACSQVIVYLVIRLFSYRLLNLLLLGLLRLYCRLLLKYRYNLAIPIICRIGTFSFLHKHEGGFSGVILYVSISPSFQQQLDYLRFREFNRNIQSGTLVIIPYFRISTAIKKADNLFFISASTPI